MRDARSGRTLDPVVNVSRYTKAGAPPAPAAARWRGFGAAGLLVSFGVAMTTSPFVPMPD